MNKEQDPKPGAKLQPGLSATAAWSRANPDALTVAWREGEASRVRSLKIRATRLGLKVEVGEQEGTYTLVERATGITLVGDPAHRYGLPQHVVEAAMSEVARQRKGSK